MADYQVRVKAREHYQNRAQGRPKQRWVETDRVNPKTGKKVFVPVHEKQ